MTHLERIVAGTPRRSQETRLAVIRDGETLVLPARRGRVVALLFVGVPLLTATLVGLIAMPALVLEAPKSDRGFVGAVLLLLALISVPVVWTALARSVPRLLAMWRGAAVWELSPDGLIDPSGAFFERPVPWHACGEAYAWDDSEGGLHVSLPVHGASAYLRSRLRRRSARAAEARHWPLTLPVGGLVAGVLPHEMADLINAARRQWGP